MTEPLEAFGFNSDGGGTAEGFGVHREKAGVHRENRLWGERTQKHQSENWPEAGMWEWSGQEGMHPISV